MSGGKWEYAQDQIKYLSEQIEEEETHPLRLELAKIMFELWEVLHAIDWSDSGDWQHDAWIEPTEKFVEKFKGPEKGRDITSLWKG